MMMMVSMLICRHDDNDDDADDADDADAIWEKQSGARNRFCWLGPRASSRLMLKVIMVMILVMTVVVFYHEDGDDSGDGDDGGDGETLEEWTCKKGKKRNF